MKKLNGFKKGLIIINILILATGLPVYPAGQNPEFSIVTDQTPGVAVLNGLTKLTDALQAKKIIFEKVQSN